MDNLLDILNNSITNDMFKWFMDNLMPWVYLLIIVGGLTALGAQIWKYMHHTEERPKYLKYMVGTVVVMAVAITLYSVIIFKIVPNYIH